MRTVKLSGVFLVCACVVLISGCVAEQQYKDLKIQNDTQRERIAGLESQLQATKLKLEQLKRKLETAEGIKSAETNALQKKIAALEEDLEKKRALIASMVGQLGAAQLPVELSTML